MVVGFKKEQVTDFFQDKVSYAVQEEQLGTGHAAYVGMKNLSTAIKNAIVMNGDDSAFYSAEMILDFLNQHLEKTY